MRLRTVELVWINAEIRQAGRIADLIIGNSRNLHIAWGPQVGENLP
jgi:hypothetical protein